jgi:hypothetical protein
MHFATHANTALLQAQLGHSEDEQTLFRHYRAVRLMDGRPATKAIGLSEEFGVSDVAIAKRCRRLNVPRPPRGYWAKIAAGRTPRKSALPPTPEETLEQALQQLRPKTLRMPASDVDLRTLAAELLQAIVAAKPDMRIRSV